MTLWYPLGLSWFVLWKLLLLYTIGLVFPPKLQLLLGTSCLLCCSADQLVLNPLLLLNTRWVSIWSCLSRSLLIFHMQGLPCWTPGIWLVIGFAGTGSPDLGKKSHRPNFESSGVVWTTTDILKVRLYFTFQFLLSTYTHTYTYTRTCTYTYTWVTFSSRHLLFLSYTVEGEDRSNASGGKQLRQ